MEMRWKWQCNEICLTGTRGGNAKEEGRSKHQHNTPGPERANPERAREEKSGDRQTRNKTSGGGGRKRLHQPTTAKPRPTQARTGPNLPQGGSTHEIRDYIGGLVDENWLIHLIMQAQWPQSSSQPHIRLTPSTLEFAHKLHLTRNLKEKGATLPASVAFAWDMIRRVPGSDGFHAQKPKAKTEDRRPMTVQEPRKPKAENRTSSVEGVSVTHWGLGSALFVTCIRRWLNAELQGTPKPHPVTTRIALTKPLWSWWTIMKLQLIMIEVKRQWKACQQWVNSEWTEHAQPMKMWCWKRSMISCSMGKV